MITNEEAAKIAQEMDHSLDAFFAAPREDKVVIIKKYLDEQIGSEANAEIKAIPGLPFIEGGMLEAVSDAVLDQVAKLIVNKWFSGS